MSKKEEESVRAATSDTSQLHRLLEEQARALEDEALRSGGQVPAERMEALRRLSSLVEICDRAQPKPARSRWPLAAAFACTLLIATVLLFAHPKSTKVEMDLRVNQVGFSIPSRQVLSEPLRLAALGVSGLKGIQLPRARGSDELRLVSGSDFESGVALSTEAESHSRGELSLPELILPVRTRVALKKTELPGQYRMTLEGADLDLKADVNGPLRVNLTGGQERQLSFLSPKSVAFEAESRQMDLDLTFLTLPLRMCPAPLTIRELSLLRVEDRRGLEGLPVREVSTILSGSIFFEELNGQELRIHPGEPIRFEDSHGEIDVLDLKEDQMVLQFHGSVRGMTAGSSEAGRSLMPTWLEWLKARRGMYLLWGTAIYLYGLVAGAMRWLRAPQ